MPPAERVTFRLGPTAVRTVAEAPAGTWLAEFAGACWDVVADDAPDHEVRLILDERRWQALVAEHGAAPAAERPCFALDARVQQHPARTLDGRLVLLDAKYEAAIALSPDGDVEIVGHPRSRRPRFACLRVVRELLTTDLRATPFQLQLHAAALARNGMAVVIAGPKRAGKTTFLIHALAASGARYLANDRVLVSTADLDVTVRGQPTSVSVRPPTLARYPRLADGIPDVQHPSHLTVAEAARMRAEGGPRDPSERVTLNPAWFARLLDVPSAAATRLASILVLEQTGSATGWELEELEGDAARAALQGCIYGHASARRAATVFEERAGYAAPDPRAHDEALGVLLARVPVLRCRVGTDVFDQPPEELLDAALVQRPARGPTAP